MIKHLLVIFSLLLIFALPEVAATPLWKVPTVKKEINLPIASSKIQQLRQQGIPHTLDRKQLKAIKINDTLQLPVNNIVYKAIIKKIKTHTNGSQTWFAMIRDGKEQLPVVLTVSEKSFFVRLVTPQGIFVMTGRGNQGRLIRESVLNQVIDSDKDDFLIPEDRTEHKKQQKIQQQIEEQIQRQRDSGSSELNQTNMAPMPEFLDETISAAPTTPLKAAEEDDTTIVQVDVLVVYTPGANNLYGGDAQTRINHLIAVTNQIYTDSGVMIQVNAVAMDLVNYSDTVNSYAALHAITDQTDAALIDIKNRRFEVGADMVIFMRPHVNSDNCGIAWVNGYESNGSVENYSHTMYSHTSIDCSDYVSAHELGHNMGLMHSRRQDGAGVTFPFALGHGVDNNFATVMAYSGWFSTSTIYKFSSPTLDCNDLPCGIDKTDEVNGADAVFALNAVRHQLAEFFHQNPDLTLVADALTSVNDSNLRDCVNTATSQPNDKYALLLYSLSCNNLAITELTGIEQFSGLNSLYLGNNQITDISPLVNMTTIQSLYLGSNQIADISPLANMTTIQSLDLSSNQVSDISPLANMTTIQSLYLDNNQITDISTLANMTTIQSLYLDNNQITDISTLANMTTIKSLFLRVNQITDISALANMTAIQSLGLGYNQIADISALANMIAIQSLELSNNQIIDISTLANMTTIQTLYLGENQITDISPLANMTAIQTLYLGANQITDISALENMTAIQYFYLDNNEIKSISPILLQVSMLLQTLDLNGNIDVPCWQLDYVEIFGSLQSWNRPTTCDNSIDENNDFDGDNLSNRSELNNGTNPILTDSDGDGMNDGFEVANGLDPIDQSDASLDEDGDGLTNIQEYLAGTNINDPDSDDDGLSDYTEVITYSTNPINADSDNDGLNDYTEVITYGTSPLDTDSDDDGMTDGYEVVYNLNPLIDDADLDNDGDGLTSLEEFQNGTDPNNIDTDGDGLSDYDEVTNHGTNPTLADTDNDGMSDGYEITEGFNPLDGSDCPSWMCGSSKVWMWKLQQTDQ